jgi:hypothetical protein
MDSANDAEFFCFFGLSCKLNRREETALEVSCIIYGDFIYFIYLCVPQAVVYGFHVLSRLCEMK